MSDYTKQEDRISVLKRITAEYNENITRFQSKNDADYELQKIVLRYKKDINDHYNLTIKQINTMYDAYEVTIGQLYAGKTIDMVQDLLKSSLMKFPKFDHVRLYTQYKTSDHIATLNIKIKLSYDIFYENSAFLNIKRYIHNATQTNKLTHRTDCSISVNLSKYLNVNNIILNYENKIIECYNMRALFINEKDIIVLWIYNELKYGIDINFIKITSGKLIYSEFYATPYRNIRFMFCNNKVIKIFEVDNSLFITPYEITTSRRKKINIQCGPRNIVSLYVEGLFKRPINIELLYSDARGLYLYHREYIYYIGDVHELPDNIIFSDLRYKYTVRLPSDIYRKHIPIINIDYIKCEITLSGKYTLSDKYVHILLGFKDACSLLY